MKFKTWLEGRLGDLARLRPDTVVAVYHGTTMTYAHQFCVKGIDAKHVGHHRLFPHFSGGKPTKFGIFVAPRPEIAFKFGRCVVKFKTLGKNLVDMFPVEMKQYGYLSKKFPQSIRPSVSNNMLSNSVEPQALFVGLVSPRAIEKVYVQEGVEKSSMSKEQFIKYAEDQNERLQWSRSHFEPQEYKMSLTDFVKRIARHEGGDEQQILDILKRVYQKNGYLTGIGDVPYSLLRRIENQVRTLLRRTAETP